ncbi:MAG: cell envelope biogenesis protein TolA [Myxococcaceae bacterium]|jgi:chromosome segregation ATPase|nr:cell envelope biogenesis protein TolA [Myxococcaceae bacterium]MCA3015665.1 cell envelope biogenesis protein TolA [Myxococcaceae bacterium]
MSLTIVIVLLAIALVVSLAFNMGFLGEKATPAKSAGAGEDRPRESRDDGAAARAGKLESELDKKRKELDEVKKAQAELKDELKAAKKKLHEQREADKTGDDLVKARAEVERQASIQLDATRQELANALAEVQRLKGEAERSRKRAEAPRPLTDARPEEKREAAPAPVQRVIRELSEAEKEKMQRLEQQSASDKKKAIELAAELRNVKVRVDREKREARRVYEEGKLARDKFRAVEIRLNRTLLENDMLRRAISDLEKRTGTRAETHAPTAEQFAESDQKMREKHAAEDQAAEDARAKLEAAEAISLEGAETTVPDTATGPVTPAAEAKADAPAPSAPPAA